MKGSPQRIIFGEFFKNAPGDNLRSRVQTRHQLACVQVAVVQLPDDRSQASFSRNKINHEPALIQLAPGKRSRNTPIVAMQRLE